MQSATQLAGEMGWSSRPILVVEDDPLVVNAIRRSVPGGIGVVLARSVKAARELLASRDDLAAAIVDLGLPDGNGMDIVRQLRAERGALPVLVLTGQLSRELVNEVYALGAGYVCKPTYHKNLRSFLNELLPEDVREGRAALSRPELEHCVARYRLTPREANLLRCAVAGVPRGRLGHVLGVTENTIKSQIRSILKKTPYNKLGELVWEIRRGAKLPSVPPARPASDPAQLDQDPSGSSSGAPPSPSEPTDRW